MIDRRTLLASVTGGAALALAGCSLLEGEIQREASPGRVGEQALAETGFEHLRTEDSRLERTVEVAGEERDLSLRNWQSEYGKLAAEGERSAAGLFVFTTPTVSVAGRSANPFQRFDEKRLIRALVERSERGGTTDLEEVDSRSVEVLEETVEFTIYRSEQDVAGQRVTVLLHFGSLVNDGDLVTILGTHPEQIDESENVYRCGEGLEHPTEP